MRSKSPLAGRGSREADLDAVREPRPRDPRAGLAPAPPRSSRRSPGSRSSRAAWIAKRAPTAADLEHVVAGREPSFRRSPVLRRLRLFERLARALEERARIGHRRVEEEREEVVAEVVVRLDVPGSPAACWRAGRGAGGCRTGARVSRVSRSRRAAFTIKSWSSPDRSSSSSRRHEGLGGSQFAAVEESPGARANRARCARTARAWIPKRRRPGPNGIRPPALSSASWPSTRGLQTATDPGGAARPHDTKRSSATDSRVSPRRSPSAAHPVLCLAPRAAALEGLGLLAPEA